MWRSPPERLSARRWSPTVISGVDKNERITAIDAEVAALKEKLAGLEKTWESEQAIVEEIRTLRESPSQALERRR